VIITFQKCVHHTLLKINFYSHMALLRILITTNNIELLTTNYEHKILIITPYLIYKFTTSVMELGSVTDSRPGPARHSRKKNHKDATKAGMHSSHSRSARSSTAVLRHQVSSTQSHTPGPLPSLIHPVY